MDTASPERHLTPTAKIVAAGFVAQTLSFSVENGTTVSGTMLAKAKDMSLCVDGQRIRGVRSFSVEGWTGTFKVRAPAHTLHQVEATWPAHYSRGVLTLVIDTTPPSPQVLEFGTVQFETSSHTDAQGRSWRTYRFSPPTDPMGALTAEQNQADLARRLSRAHVPAELGPPPDPMAVEDEDNLAFWLNAWDSDQEEPAVAQPWYVRRVCFYNDDGLRCVAYKVRWWVRPFVSVESSPGPYFQRRPPRPWSG